MKLEGWGAEGDKAPSVRKNERRKSGNRLAGGEGLSSSSFMGIESAACMAAAHRTSERSSPAPRRSRPRAPAPRRSPCPSARRAERPRPSEAPVSRSRASWLSVPLCSYMASADAAQAGRRPARCTSGPPARPRFRGWSAGPGPLPMELGRGSGLDGDAHCRETGKTIPGPALRRREGASGALPARGQGPSAALL